MSAGVFASGVIGNLDADLGEDGRVKDAPELLLMNSALRPFGALRAALAQGPGILLARRMVMTAAGFRKMCLGLRGAEEGSHMGHPDFRVGGKIFATLWQDQKWGMARLTLEQREVYMRAEPAVFRPVKGGWGARGATEVRLAEAKTKGQQGAVLAALEAAWGNIAPKKLLREIEADGLGR